VRDTQPEPTKSGVIGLLGCALGYERRDTCLEALERALRFGVRVEAPGRVLEDYQTITDYLPIADGRFKHSGITVGSSLAKLRANPDVEPATIISPRSYLEDASFLVGLEARTPEVEPLLEESASALQSPRWPLFLGRRACVPTRPIYETLTQEYLDLEDALRRHPWSWLGRNSERRETPKEKLLTYVETSDGLYRRQDALRVNPFRQYGFINLKSLRVEVPEIK
jgi:CRISPR system Cascade subunit CasD